MFENVRGLMYRNKDYLDLIITELEALDYIVEFRVLNAVQFAVPQNRERVIVVGHRGEFNYHGFVCGEIRKSIKLHYA